MSLIQYKIESLLGPLYLVASDRGLRGVYLRKRQIPVAKSLDGSCSAEKILSDAAQQLSEYFTGKRKTFRLPLDLVGTSFQKQVWSALTKIPFGKTVAYRDIAKAIKNPRAVRAVGSANGKNPLCIVIPCHRVIAADGSMGGYSGGLAMKRQLLNLEQK